MRSLFQPAFGASDKEKQLQRQQADDLARVRGTGLRPDPPRDLQAQSGARKILLTWKKPVRDEDVAGWRVYRGNENVLVMTIKDSGVQLAEISASAAASSPVENFFVSSVSPLGRESVKVQVQSGAKDEAGAPTDPDPPADFEITADTSGGGTGATGLRSRLAESEGF